ncbi:hypothetical protein V6N13_106835 [Hibiscus sabdariffa]
MSMLNIYDMIKELGYVVPHEIVWQEPWGRLKVNPLKTDNDVLTMLDSMPRNKYGVREYRVRNRYNVRLKVNERLQVMCKDGCPWMLWASRVSPKDSTNTSWQIKTYFGEHDCIRDVKNRNSTYKWVAKAYVDKFRVEPTYSTKSLRQDVATYHILQGLVDAIIDVFPYAKHRTCVRHLYSNFKLKNGNQGKALKDVLWKAVRATYMKEFTDAMSKIRSMSDASFKWLQGKDPRQWSKSHFSTRSKIMTRIVSKKQQVEKINGLLCPKIQKKLNSAIGQSIRLGDHKLPMYKVQASPHKHKEVKTYRDQ